MVKEAFLAKLDETERAQAADFLREAAQNAAEQWQTMQDGQAGAEPEAPRVEAAYVGSEGHDPEELSNDHDGGPADPDHNTRRLTAPHVQK